MSVKNNKKYIVGSILSLVVVFSVMTILNNILKANQTYAEQSGGSPESNSNSRLTVLYDNLNNANAGQENINSGEKDWGQKWNRIRSASLENYGLHKKLDCATQLHYAGHNDSSKNSFCSNKKRWSKVTGTNYDDQIDKRDDSTGLMWSYVLSNNYSQPVSSYNTAPADYISINWSQAKTACQNLGDGNWRLPTQTELMQAYVDGAYFNLTNAGSGSRWSASESNSSNAWYIYWSNGYVTYQNKSYGNSQVVCVR